MTEPTPSPRQAAAAAAAAGVAARADARAKAARLVARLEQQIAATPDQRAVLTKAMRLAELMLGPDRQAATAAEAASDRLEDVFMPVFADDVARIAALIARREEDERRRDKALAIKARGQVQS